MCASDLCVLFCVKFQSDKRDKEKIKRKEEGDKMSAILTEKTKECKYGIVDSKWSRDLKLTFID